MAPDLGNFSATSIARARDEFREKASAQVKVTSQARSLDSQEGEEARDIWRLASMTGDRGLEVVAAG